MRKDTGLACCTKLLHTTKNFTLASMLAPMDSDYSNRHHGDEVSLRVASLTKSGSHHGNVCLSTKTPGMRKGLAL